MVADSMRRPNARPERGPDPAWSGRRHEDRIGARSNRGRRRLLEREGVIDEFAGIIGHLGRTASSVVLIEGNHGSGRTALLNTACRMAHDMGIRVLRARSTGGAHAHRFGLADQIMIQLAAADDADGDPTRAPIGDPATHDHLDLVLEQLVRSARRQQVLVAIDDVDLADAPSLEWMRWATGAVGPGGVLFAGTALPPSRRLVRHPLDPIRTDGATRRIRLAPLSVRAVTDLVDRRFGPEAAASELPERCHQVTRGNPALLFALFGWLVDQEADVDDLVEATTHAAPVPIVRAITHRAYAAGPHVAAALGAVALLDGAASAADIAAVTGRPTDEIEQIVDRFVDSGDLEADEPLRFVHPIVRSAVAAALSHHERRRVHERFATFLDQRGEPALRVARHLLDSPASRNARWVEVLVTAGNRHVDDGETELAEAMLRRAVSESVDTGAHPDLALSIAALQARLAHRTAVDTFARHGTASSDATSLTAAAYTIATHLDRATDEVCRTLTLAHQRLAIRDPDGAARLEVCRALLARTPSRLIGDESEAMHSSWSPRTRALVEVHRLNRQVEAVSGEPADEIGARLAAAVTADMLVSTDPVERHIASQAVRSLLAADRVDDADALVADAMAVDPEERTVRAALAALAAQVAFRRGDLAEAMSFLTLAHRDMPGAVAGVGEIDWPTGVHLLWSQGRIDEAERFVQLSSGRSDHGDIGSHRNHEARAWLAFRAGDPGVALGHFLRAGTIAEANDIRNPALTDWRVGAARACAVLGDDRQAVSHAEAAVHLARRFGASAAIARALAASAHALPEQRVELLRRALDLAEEGSAPGLEAQIALELGSALRKEAESDEAIGVLRRAGDLSHRIGAPRLAEQILAELRAAGARPTHLALSGAASLTPAQTRIARLAGRGHTNVQIAEQHFISVKTVESHLARTYAKLGIHSRTELPTALEGVDLDDDLTDSGAATDQASDACG